jgi:hypothetical protein
MEQGRKRLRLSGRYWFLLNKLPRRLFYFQLLSNPTKFHETESGSRAKNAAHHDENLYVHWRGLLSRVSPQLLQTYTPIGVVLFQQRYSKSRTLAVAILASQAARPG